VMISKSLLSMRLLGSIGKRLAAKPTLQTDHR